MQELTGRTAFITGAASGIGLAMARVFGREGMKIAIADVEELALERTAKDLEEEGIEALALRLDVTDREAMEQAAFRVETRFGNLHLLCNNAGVGGGGPLDQCTYDDWDWVLGVNLGGVINGVQTFVRRMKAHGEEAHIVNTASAAGLMASPGLGVYCTSKFAVVGLSESLRADLEPYGIGVSVLCPGFVDTRIHDSSRNRPERWERTEYEPTPEQEALAVAILEAGMDPAEVAEAVRDAVRANEPWILTHPELKPFVAERMQAILEAFKAEPDPDVVEALRTASEGLWAGRVR